MLLLHCGGMACVCLCVHELWGGRYQVDMRFLLLP